MRINDHTDIRPVFADLHIVEVDYQYTVRGSDKLSRWDELIFYGNWNTPPVPRGQ